MLTDSMVTELKGANVDAALFLDPTIKLYLPSKANVYALMQNSSCPFFVAPQWISNFAVQHHALRFKAPDIKGTIEINSSNQTISHPATLGVKTTNLLLGGKDIARIHAITRSVESGLEDSTVIRGFNGSPITLDSSHQTPSDDSPQSNDEDSDQPLDEPALWKGWILLAIMAILVAILVWFLCRPWLQEQ